MDFKDKSYRDKRKILQNYYDNHFITNINKLIRRMAIRVKEKINDPIIDKLIETEDIIKFLIEGYLVYVIDKDGIACIKDPCNLVLNTDKNNNVIWEEWVWKDITAIYKNSEIVYITYDDEFNVSFLSLVYNGLIDINDNKLISYYIKQTLQSIIDKSLDIDKVLKIDDNIRRSFKIKKIYDKIILR